MTVPIWLQNRREAAAARLRQQPAHERQEENKYTSYRALTKRGHASFEQTDSGFDVLDHLTAILKYPNRMSSCLGALASGPWADASLSGDYKLSVLHITETGSPLRLSLRGLGQGASVPRLVILCEPETNREVEIELLDEDADHHMNLVIEVDIASNASLTFCQLQDQGRTGFATTTFAARLADNASLDAVWMDCGASMARHDVQIDLSGEGASANLSGLMLPQPDQHHDHHVHVKHGASNTASSQLFKTLVASKGRSVFSGCVEVSEGAQGCRADQLSRALLLGPRAEFDVRPQLLISFDAVEASHGSSCGAMDDDVLFFLRSRGLSAEDARYLIAQAFAAEIFNNSSSSFFADRSKSSLMQLLSKDTS